MDNPLSWKNILAGIITTVVGGVILAYIIQDARFSPQHTANATQTPFEQQPTMDVANAQLSVEKLTIEIQQNPTASSYIERGKAYRELEQFDAAISDFTHAILMNSRIDEKIQGYTERAFIYYNWLKDYRQAVADYSAAIELDANLVDPMDYMWRAESYLELNEYEKALDDFAEAIRRDPAETNDVIYYQFRAQAYISQGAYTHAIDDYGKVIEINPLMSQAYSDRGEVYTKIGDYDAAIADFNEAIRIDPLQDGFYYHRGEAYLQADKRDLAVRDFQKVIDMGGDWKVNAETEVKQLLLTPSP